MTQPAVSKVIDGVTQALCKLANVMITFPHNPQQITANKLSFFNMAGFPNVVGCIDCTHVRIKAPSQAEDVYINRKGVHTINVQAVCDAQMKLTNVVCCEVLDSGTNLSDHCAIQLMAELSVARHKDAKPNHQPIRARLRWDKANKDNYYAETYLNLCDVDMSFMKNCDGNCNGACNVYIEAVYNQVVDALNGAAASTVPKTPQKFYNFWWDEHLSDLKRRSLDAHALWVASGRPGQGDIYNNKRCAKAKYKQVTREKDKSDVHGLSNDLNDYFLSKDQEGFWKVWRSKFCKPVQTEFIDGIDDPVSVADLFASQFENACAHNSVDRSFLLLKEFPSQYDEYTGDVDCGCHITVESADRCLHSMKLQKAASLDGIETEHIVFAHPVVVLLLSELFTSILRHAYVPSGFCSGIVIPLPKDKSGDIMDSNNYRGITLSSNISKMFELCLLDRYSCHLMSSDLQFGFTYDETDHIVFILHGLIIILSVSVFIVYFMLSVVSY